MPKNTSGGKKYKKGKTAIGNDEDRALLEAEEGQSYALVTKLCGNSMINCRVFQRIVEVDSRGKESVSFNSEEKIGVIRNSLKKKKIFINANNIILVCLRDFEPGKVDVIYSYKDKEIKKLTRKNMIPSINLGSGNGNDNDNDVSYEFYDDNDDSNSDEESKIKKNVNEINREKRKERSRNEPYLQLPDDFGISENEEHQEDYSYTKNDNDNDNDNFIDNI